MTVCLPTHEPFTRQQAHSAGVSDGELHRLVRTGEFRRPVRGVYVSTLVPDSIEFRCRALALVMPEDGFICDRTAAWIYTGTGSLGPNEHLSVPPISYFRPSNGRASRGKLRHSGERAIEPRDLVLLHGLQVTTPLRTALDLGRLQHSADLRLWGMDNMLNLRAFSHDELLAELPRFKGERGVISLRTLAPLARVGSQSFGESATRLRWHQAGLPEPILQCPVQFADGGLAYLDLAYPEWGFAAEYDGEEWHSTPQQRAHDAHRRQRLAEEEGWVIEVLDRSNVFGLRQQASPRLARAALAARQTVGLRRWAL